MVPKPGTQLAHLAWYPKSAYDPVLMISFRILKWLKHVSSDAGVYKYTPVTFLPHELCATANHKILARPPKARDSFSVSSSQNFFLITI